MNTLEPPKTQSSQGLSGTMRAAAFGAAPDTLTAAVGATASSDADGTVASYAGVSRLAFLPSVAGQATDLRVKAPADKIASGGGMVLGVVKLKTEACLLTAGGAAAPLQSPGSVRLMSFLWGTAANAPCRQGLTIKMYGSDRRAGWNA